MSSSREEMEKGKKKTSSEKRAEAEAHREKIRLEIEADKERRKKEKEGKRPVASSSGASSSSSSSSSSASSPSTSNPMEDYFNKYQLTDSERASFPYLDGFERAKLEIKARERMANNAKKAEEKRPTVTSPVTSNVSSVSPSSSSSAPLSIGELIKEYDSADKKYKQEHADKAPPNYLGKIFDRRKNAYQQIMALPGGKEAFEQFKNEEERKNQLSRASSYNPYAALVAQRQQDEIQSFNTVPGGSGFSVLSPAYAQHIAETISRPPVRPPVPPPVEAVPLVPPVRKALPQLMEPQINPSLARPMQIQMPHPEQQPFGGNQLLAMLMSGAGGESKYIPIHPRQSITDKILAHFGPQMYHPEEFPEEEGGFL